MSQFVVNHCFCAGEPGLAVVRLEVDGQGGLLLPDQADQLAGLLTKHAEFARQAAASAKAAGAEQLACTPAQGVA